MSGFLDRWFKVVPISRIGFTKELMSDLRAMKPGCGMRLTAGDGKAWVVIDADDFDHIVGLGGLQLKAIQEPAKNS